MTDVRATTITAPTLTNSAIANGDTLQVAAGKLQAQVNAVITNANGREPSISAGTTVIIVTANTGISRSVSGHDVTLAGVNATGTVKGVMLLGASGDAEAFKAAGTTAQYLRGDKAWTDFATSVRGAVLTGLSTATSAAVAATDSVLTGIGKLQAQVNSLSSGSSGAIKISSF
jgi:hypothetical protein